MRTCEHCNKQFLLRWPRSPGRFCSKFCNTTALNVKRRLSFQQIERNCEHCQKLLLIGGRNGKRPKGRFCSIRCAQLERFKTTTHPVTGLVRSRSATEHPTSFDLVWAAGIFEGEGYCGYEPRKSAIRAAVSQNGLWLPTKLQALFGGSIGQRKERHRFNYSELHYNWTINGSRARGFLMTIFQFLSPRRKLQIRKALLATR